MKTDTQFNFYKLFIALSFFCNSQFSFSEVSDRLDYHDLKDIERFVSNIPELSFQNLRFYLPQDRWSNYSVELAKGNYIVVRGAYFDQNKINFFSDVSLKEKPKYVSDMASIYSGSVKLCGHAVLFGDKKSSSYSLCGECSCIEEHSKNLESLNNYEGFDVTFVDSNSIKANERKECQVPIELFISSYYRGETPELFIKLKSDGEIGKPLLVAGKGEKLYLDTSFCKSGQFCRVEKRLNSKFEMAWANLQITKVKKDYPVLNFLIANLLPCVKKRDYACVRTFFMNKIDFRGVGGDEDSFVPVQKFDENLLKNLAYCLSYDRLLPYGERTRALGDNICIFNSSIGSKQKMVSVSLPDSYGNLDKIKVNYSVK